MRKTARAIRHTVSFLCCFLLLSFPPVQAQEQVRLKEVKVQGNIRVEVDGISLHLKARAGDLFDPAVVEQDVKSIYRMGFFDDVKAELSPDGVLTYSVKERPYIKEVKIQGGSAIKRDRVEGALGVSPRTILDRDKVSEGVERVRKLYGEQGYVNARVDYAISLVENNQAVILLDIDEGGRLLIKKISFEGNRAFAESELRGLMATKEQGLLSYFTNRGVLEHDVLTNDMAILSSHYYDHGYISHRVSEPVILRGYDGIDVVIRIDEGDQYRVGKVEIGGDLIEEGQTLLKKVQLTSGQIFRGSRLRGDIATLTEMYSDRGFAFAQVEPVTKIQPEEKRVDVALVITRGPPVYFNRVIIAGNTKTRDKVIRREMAATEQELFSGNKIKQSRNALQRTGYFEDVQLTTKRTGQADVLDLLVDIKEGPTGTLSLGAGYSSGDAFIFTGSISEKNLFGRGQGISAAVDLGTTRQDFILSFTEPYLFDTPLNLGLDAFNTRREFFDFTSRKTGFGVRNSYPLRYLNLPFLSQPAALASGPYDGYFRPPSLVDYMRGGVNYELTREKIGGIDAGVSSAIAEEKGVSWTSSVTPMLSYDSRDHFFNPTEGTSSNLGLKFAGLGGDNRFLKTDLRGKWYYSFLKDPNWGGTYTFVLGGALGVGVGFTERPSGEKTLPLFERYFPGGINSIRGFKDRSLGPRDGNDVIGGDKQVIFNAELVFPIMEQFGLRGVAFFDMGQAFGDVGQKSDDLKNISFGEMRRSVGVGGRWLSPFGPLRVELGFPLNKKPGDDTSVFGFSVGSQP